MHARFRAENRQLFRLAANPDHRRPVPARRRRIFAATNQFPTHHFKPGAYRPAVGAWENVDPMKTLAALTGMTALMLVLGASNGQTNSTAAAVSTAHGSQFDSNSIVP